MAFKNELSVQEYVYDFSVDGGSTAAAIVLSSKANKSVLPSGAVVKSVYMKVLTTFTSGGSATLAWGNTSDPDGYSGAALAVASLTAGSVFNGYDNAAALLWDDTNDHPIYFSAESAGLQDVSVTIGTADMTAGKCVVVVEYCLPEGA